MQNPIFDAIYMYQVDKLQMAKDDGCPSKLRRIELSC